MTMLPMAPRHVPGWLMWPLRGKALIHSLFVMALLLAIPAWFWVHTKQHDPKLILLVAPWALVALAAGIAVFRKNSRIRRLYREGVEVPAKVTSIVHCGTHYTIFCTHPLTDAAIEIHVPKGDVKKGNRVPAVREGYVVLLVDPNDPSNYRPVPVAWVKKFGEFEACWPSSPDAVRPEVGTRAILGQGRRRMGRKWIRQRRKVLAWSALLTLLAVNLCALSMHTGIGARELFAVAGVIMGSITLGLEYHIRTTRRLFETGIEAHAVQSEREGYELDWGGVKVPVGSVDEGVTLEGGRYLVIVIDPKDASRHVVVKRSMLED